MNTQRMYSSSIDFCRCRFWSETLDRSVHPAVTWTIFKWTLRTPKAKLTSPSSSVPVQRIVAEFRGDEAVTAVADLELEELGDIVGDGEGEGRGDHGALAAEGLERVHDGEHALRVDTHGHAHGGHSGQGEEENYINAARRPTNSVNVKW